MKIYYDISTFRVQLPPANKIVVLALLTLGQEAILKSSKSEKILLDLL